MENTTLTPDSETLTPYSETLTPYSETLTPYSETLTPDSETLTNSPIVSEEYDDVVGLYIATMIGLGFSLLVLVCFAYHCYDSHCTDSENRRTQPRVAQGDEESADILRILSNEAPSYEEAMLRSSTPPPTYEKFISVIPPPLPDRSTSMQFSVHI